ncbi:MAG: FAD synthetase family protein [Clostridiales bacterium]|nr:FAD synthetase family protein [Clostridiales bacterium]
MQILHSEREFLGPASVLALGTFDGVHIGHAALLRRAKALADELGASCVACTFDRHPLSVLDPARMPRQLTDLEEKLRKFALLKADCALVQRFTPELSKLSAREYLLSLVAAMRAKAVVVGEDHRFGRRGEGNANLIRALASEAGFRAVVVPPVLDGKDVVSSSLIRSLLASGQFARAEKLLSI